MSRASAGACGLRLELVQLRPGGSWRQSYIVAPLRGGCSFVETTAAVSGGRYARVPGTTARSLAHLELRARIGARAGADAARRGPGSSTITWPGGASRSIIRGPQRSPSRRLAAESGARRRAGRRAACAGRGRSPSATAPFEERRLLDRPPGSVSRNTDTATSLEMPSASWCSTARRSVASRSPRFAPSPTYART